MWKIMTGVNEHTTVYENRDVPWQDHAAEKVMLT